MLDPKLIRQKPAFVRENLKKRQLDTTLVDKWLVLDKKYRELKQKVDALRHKRNEISEEINRLNKSGKKKEMKKKIIEAKTTVKKTKELEEQIRKIEYKLKELTLTFPNLVASLPKKEKIILSHGKGKKEKWQKDYLQIGKELNLIDFDSAIKMAGEGFYSLKGEGVRLLRALINFCLDIARKNNYKEIYIPILINQKAATYSGHLPRFKEGMYITQDGFYLSPTEEVSLLSLYADQTLRKQELPINVVAYAPSFRTEKGATKGIIRTHQFDEVELFKFVKPSESNKELQKMIKDAAQPLELLKLPFRIKLLPALDIASQSSITYDIDVFSPRSNWLEVSSCSNCLDYQARRARIYYTEKDKRNFVHTLNGTSLGINRLFVAILENYQQKDGSIKIPAVLQKYIGLKKIERKKTKK